MSRTTWIGLGAVIIIAAGALWWWSARSAPPAFVDQGAASSAVQGANDQNAGGNTAGGASAGVNTDAGNVSANVGAGTSVPMSATVSYDGNSFSPSTVTIAKGGTVKFVDTAGSSMWVASGQHPTHTLYDGTSAPEHCASGYTGPAPFDQCAAGSSFSFTFTKVGSWGYHDHRNAGAFGTVIVQ